MVPIFCLFLGPAPSVFAAATPAAKTISRDGLSGRFLLDGVWYDRADAADQGIAMGFGHSTSLSGWKRTAVPDAVNVGDYSIQSYMGSVHWYRKDFKAPSAPRGSKWLFRFESVNYRAQVWLNGKPLGHHVGAYLPFELAGKGLKKRGVNRLVVRVDGRRQRFDIPPLSVKSNGGFEGGWWNYTGILREVYLRRVVKLDITDVRVRPTLRCGSCAARVDVDARVLNLAPHARAVRLTGSFGDRSLRFKAHRIGGRNSHHFKARVRIRHPRLWSPAHPTLYAARLSLLDQGGAVVQRYAVHTGIRSLDVNQFGQVELNGRRVNLRGAAIHEDSPNHGAALTPFQMRRNVQYLRQLGATMTRAHYPLHPYELELADRYGILVWSEIPVYRMRSTLFNIPEVRDKGLRMLREEIARDQNHPSVMVWSIGNENASRPKAGLQHYILAASHMVRKLDPTRLIGIATSGFPSVERQDIYLNLDVLGINDYFGWYNGPRGSISDRAQLAPYLDRLHTDYPHHGLFITEVGAEANRSGPVTEKGTFEFQADFLKYHLGVFDSKPFINGALIWNLRDFRVKPGWAGGNPLPDPPVNHKGLVDDQGHMKTAFDVVQQLFHATSALRR